MQKTCYCDSGNTFTNCCAPIINGLRPADTAQELMRSRYSAYATVATDYLLKSTHASVRKNYVAGNIEAWARLNNWQKLEIISRTLGGIHDERGEVEFKAYYSDPNGNLIVHHENSSFIKESGEWFYLKGMINPKPVSLGSKTNRNDPCPCGSGLKFKKCCG